MPPRRLLTRGYAYLSRSCREPVNPALPRESACGKLFAVVTRRALVLHRPQRCLRWPDVVPMRTAPRPPRRPSRQRSRARRRPCPPLHVAADRLLRGGPGAFHARLASLRGYPVVVNKWASWCGPCQIEFPAFQRAAVAFGRQVAFVGVDGKDANPSAAAFLRKFPVTYPSYVDPQETHRRAHPGGHLLPADAVLRPPRNQDLRPRRALHERCRAREGHPSLRAGMTGTLTYEVRRARGEHEMAAALALRHEVFCVEQGVPEHEELDGRDHDGDSPGRRRRTASCSAPAGC